MINYWEEVVKIYDELLEIIEGKDKSINSRTSEDVIHDAIIYCYNKEFESADDIKKAIIKEYRQIRYRNLMENNTSYLEEIQIEDADTEC